MAAMFLSQHVCGQHCGVQVNCCAMPGLAESVLTKPTQTLRITAEATVELLLL